MINNPSKKDPWDTKEMEALVQKAKTRTSKLSAMKREQAERIIALHKKQEAKQEKTLLSNFRNWFKILKST